MKFDVIIIGSGMAGLPCAIKAAGGGKSILLVNKNKKIGGKLSQSTGQIAAAGTKLQSRNNIEDNKDSHLNEAWNICKGSANLQLLRLAIDNAAETVDWLEEIGVQFPSDHPVITYQHDIYSTRRYQWPIGYGREILENFSKIIDKYVNLEKIILLNETTLIDFTKDNNGEIDGVILESKNNKKTYYKSKQIVIAAGGYTNNDELFKKFSPQSSLYTPYF